MIESKIHLVFHSDLEEEIFDIGWFPKYLEAKDKDLTKEICCFEFRVDIPREALFMAYVRRTDAVDEELPQDVDSAGNTFSSLRQFHAAHDAAFEDAIEALTKTAWQLTEGVLGKAYLVLVEVRPQVKSRIRTYKGVFPYKGQIKQGDYIEKEIKVSEKESFIMGMTPITDANKEECFSREGGGPWSFILLSPNQETNIYSTEFLESIVPCLNIERASVWVSSMKLVPKICRDDLMMLEFGSDGGETYVNLRLFANKKMEGKIRKAVSLYYC
jgi:hypothetical protein